MHELRQHQAWQSYVKGDLDIELLVGNAANLLRDPYTRDLAARLLRRIGQQSDGIYLGEFQDFDLSKLPKL